MRSVLKLRDLVLSSREILWLRSLVVTAAAAAAAAPLRQSLHVVAIRCGQLSPSSVAGYMAKGDARFALRIVPFLAMMGFGSWGLSQFLKMPTQMKDARAKDRRANRQKFDLEKENERLQSEMQETLQNYENVRVPGPRRTDRVAAD